MQKLLEVRHIHSLLTSTLGERYYQPALPKRKVLSTCFTNEKKGLKKSDNFEKSSKMFNDTELVSTRTRIQSLGPEPSQLMREERMQSSSFCIGFFFFFSFTPKPVPFTPNPFFFVLHPEGGSLETEPPGLTFPLPTGWIWPTGGTGRKLKGRRELRSGCIFSIPFLLHCPVFGSGYAPPWLQLLLGRPFCIGSSSPWTPANTISFLRPREVMAYCYSQFLGVSPSLACSLNPGHNSVSGLINNVSSFEPPGMYPISYHNFV